MIIVCSTCATRLQLDDAKIPNRAFTVKCPKCQTMINGQPPGASAANGTSGASANSVHPAGAGLASSAAETDSRFAAEPARYRRSAPAPAFRPERSEANGGGLAGAAPFDMNELVRLLGALVQRTGTPGEVLLARQGPRRVLVCVTPEHREAVGCALVEGGKGYEVYIAADTSQALERMREEHMDVLILEPDFDAVEKGAAFIMREISALRPAERRRLFIVYFSSGVRTADSLAAFNHEANLVVNPADTEDLLRVLEIAIRDYNELYRDFNAALGAPAI
jgi:predicted Zn finger-like uncharacterized protein